MARKQRITNGMRAFLPFLQRMERQGKAFSVAVFLAPRTCLSIRNDQLPNKPTQT